jgi:GLPGLI family protein
MKNRKSQILLILCLFLICQISSQEIYMKVTYKKASTIILKKKKNSYATKIIEQTQEEMNKLEYVLLFNNSASIFKEIPKMEIGSDDMAIKLGKLFGDTSGVFYTDKKTGKTYREQEFESELFQVEHNKITDWILTQENKKIGKYTCYKATKKDSYIGSSGVRLYYNVTAWYTLELPYNYGPIKYNGLPGLILEIENRQAKIYVEKIEVNPKQKEPIIKPTKGEKIMEADYDKMITGLATDFIEKHRNN